MFQKKVVEKIKTHTIYAIIFFQKIVPFYIMLKNTVEAAYDNIVWRMRIACWITRAKNTYSE